MQVRCTNCGIPFTLTKELVHAALDHITEQGLKHYDARCPNCRKITPVAKPQLLKAAPDWSETKPADSPVDAG